MRELAALSEKPGPTSATWVASVLFALSSLLASLTLGKVNNIEDKVDRLSQQMPAVTERVEGVRERVTTTEDRLARVERTVFFEPWEGRRNGK